MTQVFLKALEGTTLNDDFQGIIQSLPTAYPPFAGPYFVPGLEPTLWRLAAAKGLEPEGMVSLITRNGLPIGIDVSNLINQDDRYVLTS
jgi:hypothetical protein